MSHVSVRSYTRAHTSVYVSDHLRALLKDLVRRYGLNPVGVIDAWDGWIDHAARTWLATGHLRGIVIEFYWPGSSQALARWDFPIRYDGGDHGEMWTDRPYFEQSIPKSRKPPKGSNYRIVLQVSRDAPHIPGTTSTRLRSVAGLVARDAGTVIATPDIMASGRYYR